MALDFPNSPAVGDLFTDPTSGASYKWNGYGWLGGNPNTLGALVISDTPPLTPNDNSLWFESDTGALYLRYNDGTSTQWIQLNALSDSTAFVRKAGDTMTGNLVISTGNAILVLNKPAGPYANGLTGRVNNVDRWQLIAGNSTTEPGSGNVGSDFQIFRCTDAGALIDAPLLINRSTGAVTLKSISGVTDGSNAAAGQVGEVISSIVAAPGAAVTSNTAGNITSITLTPGDWDIAGEVGVVPTSAAITQLYAWFGPTNAAAPAMAMDGSRNLLNLAFSSGTSQVMPLRTGRVSLSASTVYYLGRSAIFASGTVTAYGMIWARRIR